MAGANPLPARAPWRQPGHGGHPLPARRRRSRRRTPPLAVVPMLIAALLAAGCGASARRVGHVQTAASPVVSIAGGGPAHVAVIVMENEEYPSIIGAAQTPFINGLARRYALARSLYATTHPSLPNYLALTGGATFGIDSDCTDCRVTATGLADQLRAAGLSWKAYMEDLPHPCFTGPQAGDYAKKHDPFAYYTRVTTDPAQCGRIVPFAQLAADERAHRLPRFLWITPNLCHDMHDCAPARGDAFLSGFMPSLLRSLGPGGVLFLTWDEGSSDDGCCRLAAGGHIVTIVAGDGARAAARLNAPADQFSVLQAIEDLLGLPRLRGAACACTPSLAPLLRATPARRRPAGAAGPSRMG